MALLQAIIPWSTIALSSGTPKSVGSAQAPSNQAIKILEVKISHDGATSTNAPGLVEFCRCTFAGAGTKTSTTPLKKDPGRQETVQTSGGTNYTVEPTVVTQFDPADVPQYNGIYHYQTPFANNDVVPGGQGFLVRETSPNGVNSTGKLEFEEG